MNWIFRHHKKMEEETKSTSVATPVMEAPDGMVNGTEFLDSRLYGPVGRLKIEVKPSIAAPGVLLEVENPVKQIKSVPMPSLAMTGEDLDREIERLRSCEKDLLPIECSDEHRTEIRKAALLLSQTKLDLMFPRLDPAFLTWRRKDGWPSLAIFSLESPDCEFAHETTHWTALIARSRKENKGRHWPERFRRKYYEDVYRKLEYLAMNEVSPDTMRGCASIRARFSGLLPDKTKAKMEGLKEHFGTNMFVVREAPEWKLETWIAPEKWDPLLVGVCGDGLWLLDDFDLTPLERIIKSEWATGPQKE